MNRIVKKETLAPNTVYMKIEAPEIARKAKPGQFIILRVDEFGERFPISLAGWDGDEGTLEITYGIMGKSTLKLSELGEGESISNITGPLGNPSEIGYFGEVICASGHFGIGPMVTAIQALKEKGNRVISVLEAANEGTLFWEDRLKAVADEAYVVTGDGSRGENRAAHEFIRGYLEAGKKPDRVLAFGRVFMMMRCAKVTEPFDVKTVVSLTPIMVDGTGMCGCCRVAIGEETKFACVHGPEFDGHHVDWELLIRRKGTYIKEEAAAYGLDDMGTLGRLSELAHLP